MRPRIALNNGKLVAEGDLILREADCIVNPWSVESLKQVAIYVFEFRTVSLALFLIAKRNIVEIYLRSLW
jgi:hypothetical protein